MRHLKTYENMSDNLHIGDYILVHYDLDPVLDIELANYLNNNIGQIPYGSDLSKKYITVNYHTTPNKRILDYFQDQTDYEKTYNIYRMIIFNVLIGLLMYAVMYAFLNYMIPGGMFNAVK